MIAYNLGKILAHIFCFASLCSVVNSVFWGLMMLIKLYYTHILLWTQIIK